jgi:phosphotransferase system IIB component
MSLPEIRKAYDKNYQEMLAVIQEIGGEKNIVYHKINKSRLYQKLRKLQKIEHRLSKMEESLSGNT